MSKIPFRTGDIVFVRTKYKWYNYKTWLAPFIRLFDKVKYNHVFLLIWINGILYRFEATEHGVEKNLFIEKTIREDNKILVLRPTFDISQNQIEDIKKVAQRLIGTPYDWKGTLFDQLILQKSGKWVGGTNEKEESKRLYCTELVIFIFYLVFSFPEFKEFYKADPAFILKSTRFINIFEGKLEVSEYLS